MNINRRVEDLTQVFDKRWTANQNKATKQVENQKNQINKMFNIQNKTTQRKEILYQNSVEGQVNALNERMRSMQNNRMNNFRNGLK